MVKVENNVEKMEHLYFKADLQGLIVELSKYCSLDKSLNLVQSVDYINYINLNHRLDEEYFLLKKFI